MQIRREGAEAAHWLGGAVPPPTRHMHPRSDINCSRVRVHHRQCTSRLVVARFFPSHRQPSCCGAEGLGCAVVQFPTRDRRMASPLSSPQQPMDHVFLRGHSPPKSTRPLPSVRRIELRRFYAHRADAVRDRFFEGDVMASEESRQRAAAPWDSPLVQGGNDLIQRQGSLPADEGEDLLGILFQWGSAAATGHCLGSPVLPKTLYPADGGLALAWDCSAASRRAPPASTKSITRILNSPGYGPRIGQPSGESMR